MDPLHSLKTSLSMPALNCNAPPPLVDTGNMPSLEQLSRQLTEHITAGARPGQVTIAAQALNACAVNLTSQIDLLKHDLMAGLPTKEREETARLQATTQKLLDNGGNIAPSTTPGTEQHGLALHMRQIIQRLSGADYLARGRAMLDFVGGVLANDANESTGGVARHAGTALSVALRTGTLVVLTTLLRQMVGFALEKNFQNMDNNASFTPRMISGIASLLIGPALNLAGAARDEINGSATTASRASRLAMGLIGIGGLYIASAYDPVAVIGDRMSSIGPQLAAYTLSRDVIQTFFPLHDNGGINAKGLFCSSVMYGMAQMLLGEGMTNLAPQSGAEYVMSQAGRLAEHMASWSTAASLSAMVIEPNYLHDLMRSCLNATVEMFDDIQRPALMRYFSSQRKTDASSAESESLTAKPFETSSGDMRSEKNDAGLASEQEYPSLSSTLSSPVFFKKPRADHASTMTLRSEAVGGNRSSAEQLQRRREGLRIGLDQCRVGAGRWPTRAQFADQMLTTCAMRTSVFEAIVGIAVTVATALSKTDLAKSSQAHLVHMLIGGLVMVGYPAFVGAHLVKPPGEDSANQREETKPGQDKLTTSTPSSS